MKISQRTRIGSMWPVFELLKDKTTESNAIIHGWLKPVVEKALREKAEAKSAGGRKEEEKTFLSHLADSTDGQHCLCFHLMVVDTSGAQ